MNITKIAGNFAQNITKYTKTGADIASKTVRLIKNGTDEFIPQRKVGDFTKALLLDFISRYTKGYDDALNAGSKEENFYRFINAVFNCKSIAYLKGVLDGTIKNFLKN